MKELGRGGRERERFNFFKVSHGDQPSIKRVNLLRPPIDPRATIRSSTRSKLTNPTEENEGECEREWRGGIVGEKM